jgi:trimethylamine:corrinoid methyltransferase-like protein
MNREELLALKREYESDLEWLTGGYKDITERKLKMINEALAKAEESERLIARLEGEIQDILDLRKEPF